MPEALPTTLRFDGERFRSLREERGLTREDVASRAGCSVSRIAHVELGYNCPSVDKAATLAAILGVRVDDLIIPVAESEAVAK